MAPPARERVEISDLIVDYDPQTLARRPVRKQDVLERFAAEGNRAAARIVRALPERDGVLDPDAVDRLLVRVHCEIQRLWEEFEHGPRLLGMLAPLVRELRARDPETKVRVVDVGSGLGFGVRWLAASRALAGSVELLGVDYNAALVAEANRLAELEGLDCRFLVGNAFRLEHPAHVLMSTGVVHHFRGDGLVDFFAAQAAAAPAAFVHFDMEPTYLTPIGAWIFHKARMREPLSHHDGILSALRAHPASRLLGAARAGAPAYATTLLDADHGLFPILDLFHAVLGVRPDLREGLVARLGSEARRLGSWGP